MKAEDHEPEIKKRLHKLQKNFENVKKDEFKLSPINIEFIKNRLLIPDFMMKYTNFSDFNEMINSSEFTILNEFEFEKITLDSKWDLYIAKTTSFNSWQEMINQAVLDNAIGKFKNGIEKKIKRLS